MGRLPVFIVLSSEKLASTVGPQYKSQTTDPNETRTCGIAVPCKRHKSVRFAQNQTQACMLRTIVTATNPD